jgi:Co/Zn/Cd efflux system component
MADDGGNLAGLANLGEVVLWRLGRRSWACTTVALKASVRPTPTAARSAKLVQPQPIPRGRLQKKFALFKPAHYFRAMADCCCTPPPLNLDPHRGNSAYRRALWAVLAINTVMFLVEIGAGVAAGSASLQADALDFLGDAANYAISLLVVGMALRYRATAALAEGATMGVFGLWVIGTVVWHLTHGTLPSAFTMGAVGFAALVANAVSFGMLWLYREGDANMRSAWICTRNDVLGNFAVLLAALGVFGSGMGWPDIIVAAIMAVLALQGAATVVRQSLDELRRPVAVAAE